MRLLFLALLCLATVATAQRPTTISGVVIQQDEDFAIAEIENMKPIALLRGIEFSDGNFAYFVGQTVTVRGTLATEKGRKVLRVRRLSDVQRTASQPQARQLREVSRIRIVRHEIGWPLTPEYLTNLYRRTPKTK